MSRPLIEKRWLVVKEGEGLSSPLPSSRTVSTFPPYIH